LPPPPQLKDKLIEHKQYIDKNGEDLPEIWNWKWPATDPANAGVRDAFCRNTFPPPTVMAAARNHARAAGQSTSNSGIKRPVPKPGGLFRKGGRGRFFIKNSRRGSGNWKRAGLRWTRLDLNCRLHPLFGVYISTKLEKNYLLKFPE
jgi:hypothetical protein